MNRKFSFLLIFALFFVVGCGAIGGTGQTSNDAAAVQQYFPTINGYTSTPANDIVDAITTVTSGASLATGNILGTAAIQRLNAMIDCYREVGAVDAKVYTRVAIPPVVGALMIVNQDRAAENFLSCAVGATAQSNPRSPEPQPCIKSGSFKSNNNTFLYVYAASDQELCTAFDTHFAQYGAN
jgi:hypothetical protein